MKLSIAIKCTEVKLQYSLLNFGEKNNYIKPSFRTMQHFPSLAKTD